MKRVILLALSLLILMPVAAAEPDTDDTAQSTRVAGEKTLGPKVGYITYNESMMFALAFTYRFSEYIRVAPEIGYVVRHHKSDALYADVNVHVPLSLGTPRASLYPLIGLNLASWNKAEADPEGIDVSKRLLRAGLNLGAGMGFKCNRTLKLNIEAKYCLMKDFSSFQAAVGLSYIF